MFKQSDLVYKENSKSYVWAEFSSKDYMYELGTGVLFVVDALSGNQLREVWLDKDTAACARKTIINLVNGVI